MTHPPNDRFLLALVAVRMGRWRCLDSFEEEAAMSKGADGIVDKTCSYESMEMPVTAVFWTRIWARICGKVLNSCRSFRKVLDVCILALAFMTEIRVELEFEETGEPRDPPPPFRYRDTGGTIGAGLRGCNWGITCLFDRTYTW